MPDSPDFDFDVAAADHAMRHWRGPEERDFRIGSEAHRRLFCQMLLETHNPYKPAVIAWPKLDAESLRRITTLPIWDLAVQTEGRASIRVNTFAATIRNDDLLRRALEMDGGEEARHKLVLSRLVEAYGITLAPEPPYPPPRDAEWAWIKTGYSECVDSFFAFGLFDMARRSGFFPEALVETFEPVIQEEARHILFFANWTAWHRRNISWWRRPIFRLRVAGAWIALAWERLQLARGAASQARKKGKAPTGDGGSALVPKIEPRAFLELCLSENQRRMAGYDPRLLRPETVPKLVRFAVRFL